MSHQLVDMSLEPASDRLRRRDEAGWHMAEEKVPQHGTVTNLLAQALHALPLISLAFVDEVSDIVCFELYRPLSLNDGERIC
jgi:hypothetical protein